jgi:hypothetical protein
MGRREKENVQKWLPVTKKITLYLVQRLKKQRTVERLYCKRPILCLASSKILTPHPLTARRVCIPPTPAFGAGGGYTR